MMNLVKRYNKPTPKKWHQLGDALLIVGSTITTYAIFEQDRTLALISLVCTVLGKIIPSFITEDENTESINSNTSTSTDCKCGGKCESCSTEGQGSGEIDKTYLSNGRQYPEGENTKD